MAADRSYFTTAQCPPDPVRALALEHAQRLDFGGKVDRLLAMARVIEVFLRGDSPSLTVEEFRAGPPSPRPAQE